MMLMYCRINNNVIHLVHLSQVPGIFNKLSMITVPYNSPVRFYYCLHRETEFTVVMWPPKDK